MIIDIIIGGLVVAINGVFSILPDGDALPTQISSFFEYLNDYLEMGNAIAPVGDILAVCALILTIEGIIITYRLIMKIYGMIRGGSQ